MEMPNAADLVPLILKSLAENSVPVKEMKPALARGFGIGPHEINVPFPPGSNRTFENLFNAAAWFLRHQKLAVKVSRKGALGYQITETGRAVADGAQEFNRDLFDRIFEPELKVWASGVRENETTKAQEEAAERERAKIRELAAESAAPVLALLAAMPLKRMHRLLENAEKISADETASPEKREAASLVIDAVHTERQRRGADNPALAWMDGSFRWPSTVVHSGGGGLALEADEEGLLSTIGYHVGRTKGEAPYVRRRLLSRIFEGELPDVGAWQHSWGRPGTGSRLKKLAETIAAMTRNAKRRRQRMDAAVADWEDDLHFLHERFYVGRFDFQWPTTAIAAEEPDSERNAR